MPVSSHGRYELFTDGAVTAVRPVAVSVGRFVVGMAALSLPLAWWLWRTGRTDMAIGAVLGITLGAMAWGGTRGLAPLIVDAGRGELRRGKRAIGATADVTAVRLVQTRRGWTVALELRAGRPLLISSLDSATPQRADAEQVRQALERALGLTPAA